MQISKEDYDPSKHGKFPALTVKNPFAHYISKGWKTIEVRSKKTKFRGRLVITSSQSPEIEDMISGATLCTVEVYDCIQIKYLSAEDWDKTFLPHEDKDKYSDHYGWMLKEVKPVVELPVKGSLGIWGLILDKDELTEYPVYLNDYISKRDETINAEKSYRKLLRTGIAVSIGGLIIAALIAYFSYKLLL